MDNWNDILNRFLIQTQSNDLKYSSYPKNWSDLILRISFGMGVPARVPWIAFITEDMKVSEGFYPVYLFYKETNTLILAYGISETMQYSKTWPEEILSSNITLKKYFNKKIPRYGDSFVFKAYKVKILNNKIEFQDPESQTKITEETIKKDLQNLIENYKKILLIKTSTVTPNLQGVFYMEKQ